MPSRPKVKIVGPFERQYPVLTSPPRFFSDVLDAAQSQTYEVREYVIIQRLNDGNYLVVDPDA